MKGLILSVIVSILIPVSGYSQCSSCPPRVTSYPSCCSPWAPRVDSYSNKTVEPAKSKKIYRPFLRRLFRR